MSGFLFVISSPIGNLSDITLRALDTIKNVDIIVCEDTRITGKLLKKFKIKKKMISFNEHNEANKIEMVIEKLLDGFNIGLLCDAGTPTISDPGYRLLSDIREKHSDISIIPISGISACISALSVSGLPSDSFFFCGFLPKKKGRQKKLKELSVIKSSIILYESPFRINKTLNEIYSIFSNRKIFIAREMTKMYEEYIYSDLKNIISSPQELKKKGEYVIVIAKEGYMSK